MFFFYLIVYTIHILVDIIIILNDNDIDNINNNNYIKVIKQGSSPKSSASVFKNIHKIGIYYILLAKRVKIEGFGGGGGVYIR